MSPAEKLQRVQALNETALGALAGCGGSGQPADSPAEAAGQAAEGKSCCKGKNECKGKGGCRGGQHSCSGQNECKGQGG
jgi:hypothetical protein